MQPSPSIWFRAGGWTVVGAGAIGLGLLTSRSPAWAGAALGLSLVVGFVGVLVVEATWLGLGLLSRDRWGRQRPLNARMADGIVNFVSMAGVTHQEADDRVPWKRFARLDPTAAVATRLVGPVNAANPGNPMLLGEVVLVSVFVGRDGHRWSDREIRHAHQAVEWVGRWIEREAVRWQAPVNISLADTYFQVEDDDETSVLVEYLPEGDDVGPMEVGAAVKSMTTASRVAALLGFADVAALVSQINARIPADAHAWLIHLKQRGRSHAIPAEDGMVQGVGLAICYARESSFPEPLIGPARVDPTTVAHELLHLFGASDKYGIPPSQFAPGTVPRSDVMRLSVQHLDRLKIGKLTAIEVGWPVG